MSNVEIERLKADLIAGKLNDALATSDIGALNSPRAITWFNERGYAVTLDDMPADSGSQALDEETLDGIAGGNLLMTIGEIFARALAKATGH